MKFEPAITFLKENTINGDVVTLKITLDHSHLFHEVEVDADDFIDFLSTQRELYDAASSQEK